MNLIPEERQLDPCYGNPDRKSTANDLDGREDFQRQGPSKNSMSHRSDEIVEARQMSHKQLQFREEITKMPWGVFGSFCSIIHVRTTIHNLLVP